MLKKYCWKKALLTAGSAAPAKLLTTSKHTVYLCQLNECQIYNRTHTVQTRVSNITHRVLDSPDNAVHKQFKLVWRNTQ